MKRVSTLLAAMGLVASAHAATVSFQFGLPIVQSTTEINQTGLLGLFNPALGTLTGATLTYFANGSTTITLSNTATQDQTARATSAMDVIWTSSFAAIDPLLNDMQLLYSTGAALTYTPGQTRVFGLLNDSENFSPDLSGLLASLTGVGTFSLRCETQTSITVIGGGGNMRAVPENEAGCGAQITYAYTTRVTEIPEPPSLALAGLAMTGLVVAARRGRKV